eukprot:sb/3475393/
MQPAGLKFINTDNENTPGITIIMGYALELACPQIRSNFVTEFKTQISKLCIYNPIQQEPTETSKQRIRTSYLGHVTGYQPIRDQYFLIRSVSAMQHEMNTWHVLNNTRAMSHTRSEIPSGRSGVQLK